MIIEFAVSNFRSFKDKQVIDFRASKVVKEFRENVTWPEGLVRSAVIFGANASGKSNLLRAIEELQLFVRKSNMYNVGDKIPHHMPFRLEKGCEEKPTSFEAEFIGENHVRYKYLVSFNADRVVREELFHYPKKQRAKLFCRIDGKMISFGGALKSEGRSVGKQLPANVLFLSRGANSQIEVLQIPFLFLTKYLYCDSFETMTTSRDRLLPKYLSIALGKNQSISFKKLEKLVRLADTGIELITARERGSDELKLPEGMREFEKRQIIDRYKYEIKTIHNVFDAGKKAGEKGFELREESAGTQNLMLLGFLAFDAIGDGSFISFDEFDSSLHPILSQVLLKLFHSKVNRKGAQLLFSSHNTTLLQGRTFRRDQVWLCEKDNRGASMIFRLSDIKGVRKEIPFERWYLSGKFGGIPSIDDFRLAEDPSND